MRSSDICIAQLVMSSPEFPRIELHYPSTPITEAAIREVLHGYAYPVPSWLPEPKAVLDIGAHVGAAALWFSYHWPHAKVVAYEPVPETFELLARNTRGSAAIEAIRVALSDANGRRDMAIAEDSVLASFGSCTHPAYQRTRWETVSCAMAADALEGVQEILDCEPEEVVVKADTEGHEIEVLRGLCGAHMRLEAIYVEFHSERDRREIDGMLAPSHALEYARITSAHRGTLLYVRRDIPRPDNLEKLEIAPCYTA